MQVDKSKIIIPESSSIRETMMRLDAMPLGIIVLVNESRELKGIVTDGDIRRALASGTSIDSPVSTIMNRNPVSTQKGDSNHRILRLFNEKIRQIPVTDGNGRVVDVLLYNDYLAKAQDLRRHVVVRCKAPLRISFAGGGTDIDSYIKAKSGAVLSTTINKFCRGTLIKRDDEKIVIHSSDYEVKLEISSISAIQYNGELDLIKAVIKLMRPDFGMDLHLESDVLPRTGLGGSSSAAVVTAGLLNYFREEKLDDYQLAEIAFQAERVELGISGGWQDQYASVFGGFNFMEFRDNDVFIHPLRLKQELLNELETSLVLCFMGQSRSSAAPAAPQASDSNAAYAALDMTRDLTLEMRNFLLKGELSRFGESLHTAWEGKKKFTGGITNPKVEHLYQLARENGALGGKVLGAAGGAYILFFCPPLAKHKMIRALRAASAETFDFSFDSQGLQTWTAKA